MSVFFYGLRALGPKILPPGVTRAPSPLDVFQFVLTPNLPSFGGRRHHVSPLVSSFGSSVSFGWIVLFTPRVGPLLSIPVSPFTDAPPPCTKWLSSLCSFVFPFHPNCEPPPFFRPFLPPLHLGPPLPSLFRGRFPYQRFFFALFDLSSFDLVHLLLPPHILCFFQSVTFHVPRFSFSFTPVLFGGASVSTSIYYKPQLCRMRSTGRSF